MLRRLEIADAFRALRHRNFRLFFAGQCVSLIGTWMQQVAMQWVVYLLTRGDGDSGKTAFWLGLVGFANQIPTFFLAPVAGVLADRWNRHRVILATQTAAMLQAFLLAALTYRGAVTVEWLPALGLVLGVINSFDVPARQAFLSEMIDDKSHLSNAIALNSSMFNAARLVGPALAAALLAAVGAPMCFLVNALSYLAVLAALLMMRVKPRAARPHPAGLLHGVREGLAYIADSPPLRSILLLVALISLTATSYAVLLPIIAANMLGGDERTFGLLTTSAGGGALCGAVFLATRKSVVGLGRWIAVAPALSGCGLFALSFTTSPLAASLVLVVAGFGIMVQMGSSNIVMQTIVDEDKRGRVMSLYTAAFFGLTPFGSLAAGFIAGRYGVPVALWIGAGSCLIGSATFAAKLPRLHEAMHPIYVRMGIVPDPASPAHAKIDSAMPDGGRIDR